MPEAHTHTRTATLVQQGRNLAGLVWGEGLTSLGFPAVPFPSTQGCRFQIYTDMRSEKPRVRSLTLNLSATTYGFGPVVLGDIYVVLQNLTTSTPYSATNLPPFDLELRGTADLTDWIRVATLRGPVAIWSNPITPATATIPIGLRCTEPVTGNLLYDLSVFSHILESCCADGILNMSIQLMTTGGSSYANLTPTLVIEELDFFTGVAGTKGRERGDSRVRVVRDSRFGMPAWSDELVEDGDSPGVWVKPKHSDPEDPEREYIGNPREGARDDDVPLE